MFAIVINLKSVFFIAYILSWSSIFCGSLLYLYNIITSHGWISLWHALAPLNSLANPLIFLIFNWKKFLNNNSRRRKSNVLLLRDKEIMFRSCSSSYDRTSAISSTYTYWYQFCLKANCVDSVSIVKSWFFWITK